MCQCMFCFGHLQNALRSAWEPTASPKLSEGKCSAEAEVVTLPNLEAVFTDRVNSLTDTPLLSLPFLQEHLFHHVFTAHKR